MFTDDGSFSVADADRFHQVAGSLGDKGRAIEILSKAVTAENCESGGSGCVDELVVLRGNGAALISTIYTWGDPDRPDTVGADASRNPSFHLGVSVAKSDVGEGVISYQESAIAVVKQSPIVIAVQAPLATKMSFLHYPLALNFLVTPIRFRVVDPIIQPEDKAVCLVFDISSPSILLIDDNSFSDRLEAAAFLEEKALLICPEDTVIEQVKTAGEKKFIEEDHALIDHPIAGGVGQYDDAPLSDVFAGSVDVWHVTDKLTNPHPSVRVELHHARHVDKGLSGDRLDDKTRS